MKWYPRRSKGGSVCERDYASALVVGEKDEGRFEGKVWGEGEGERGNLREGKWGEGGGKIRW